MNYYLEVLSKYAVFSGRARRMEYWVFTFTSIIVTVALAALDIVLGLYDQRAEIGLLSGLYTFAVLIPTLAVGVRRLHDTDRSGWWLFIGLIPIIGPIVLLVFFCLDSKPGTNEYGVYPK